MKEVFTACIAFLSIVEGEPMQEIKETKEKTRAGNHVFTKNFAGYQVRHRGHNFRDLLRGWILRRRRRVYRNVKDRLFRFLFENDREALLQLYNALNGSS